MATFDRFDICEAYAAIEADYNAGGVLQERPSNKRRSMSTDFQLGRMKFEPSPLSYGFRTLSDNGKDIYIQLCKRYGFQLRTYGIWTIEAWADGDGGWTWNDKRRLDTVEVPQNEAEDTFVQILKDRDYLKPSARYVPERLKHFGRKFTKDEVLVEDPNGMGEVIEVQAAVDGEPLFAFILEESEG